MLPWLNVSRFQACDIHMRPYIWRWSVRICRSLSLYGRQKKWQLNAKGRSIGQDVAERANLGLITLFILVMLDRLQVFG